VRVCILAAGTGSLHCGACIRDLALARGLIARGHDVSIVPLYLPISPAHGDIPTLPVQLDGINAWLQQASKLFRRTPIWFDHLLACRPLLHLAGRMAGTTRASGLGPLTVSVLRGDDGYQRKQVRGLLETLAPLRPETVLISNALLLGLAPALRTRFGVPLLCGLQGEESFLNDLPQPWRGEAEALMRAHAAAVDRFIAPYAGLAAAWPELAEGRIAVLPTGLDARLLHPAAQAPPAEPLTVASCAVLLRRKGPDLLLAAAAALPKDLRRRLRLVLAGPPLDRALAAELRTAATEGGVTLELPGRIDEMAKRALLQRAHVFCVPSRVPEARGLAGLEALACGAPLLAPAAGVFSGLARAHAGVTLFRCGDVEDLTQRLAGLLADPAAARAAALRGAASLAASNGIEAVGVQAEALIRPLLTPA